MKNCTPYIAVLCLSLSACTARHSPEISPEAVTSTAAVSILPSSVATTDVTTVASTNAETTPASTLPPEAAPPRTDIVSVSESSQAEVSVSNKIDIQASNVDIETDFTVKRSQEQIESYSKHIAEEIKATQGRGVLPYPPTSMYEQSDGTIDFDRQYIHLLESFYDDFDSYEAFGGGYVENGYLHIMVTDAAIGEEFLDVLDCGNVMIHSCQYSFEYLCELKEYLFSFPDWGDGVYMFKTEIISNSVIAGIPENEPPDMVYEIAENAGFSKNALIIKNDGIPVVNVV